MTSISAETVSMAEPGGTSAPSAVRQSVLRRRKSVEEGLVAEEEYLEALARRLGAPLLRDPPSVYLAPVEEKVPCAFMEEFLLVPVRRLDTGEVQLIIARDLDDGTMHELWEFLGVHPPVVVAPRATVLELVERVYGAGEEIPIRAVDTAGEGADLRLAEDGEGLANQPPVIRLVNFLVQEAHRKGASDVHLEAREEEFQVRYRIDGALRDVASPPRKYQAAVIARIKVLADLDVTERRRPQDGRIKLLVDGRAVDVRVSTVPTLHGESLVLRLLDQESIRLPLEGLGFERDTLTRFTRLITLPHGIILVTGPTGSGKTTTLYATLREISAPERKIFTVEDPVEYQLDGINQMPVRPKLGLSFAQALRSILRQDPDVLMVGEMRDLETAEIAIQAALTGHLVFSTLHTNDAPSGITRLAEMGIEAYLTAATVRAILAQRLVRTVCRECAEPLPEDAVPDAWRSRLFPTGESAVPRRGVGCAACDGTGYRGRTGIFELLEVDEAVRTAIHRAAVPEEIRRLGVAGGRRRSLQQDGLSKVRAGVTTLEEVLRVTRDERAVG